MSSRIPYSVEGAAIRGFRDEAIVLDGEVAEEVIAESVLTAIGTYLNVTIGGVTMFLAAWRDPRHWAEDWEAKLGVDADEVPEAVAKLLSAAAADREQER